MQLGSEPWIPDKQILEICHCRSETILLTPNSSCEACSAFTRVAACTLARSPYFVTRYPKASDISSPPCLLRLLPAGAVAGWDLHPLESAAFSRRTPVADLTGRKMQASRHHVATEHRESRGAAAYRTFPSLPLSMSRRANANSAGRSEPGIRPP